MKKFILALTAVVMMGVQAASADSFLKSHNMFNHLGVSVGVGTLGVSVEAATPITRFIQMRAGVHFMPGFHVNESADVYITGTNGSSYGGNIDDTIDVEGSMKRTQGSIIFNIYPFPVGSFYVAAGAFFGGADLVKVTGTSQHLRGVDGNVEIGDYRIPLKDGSVEGSIRVKKFRPYLGLGWGRPVPKRLLNFNVELGVQFHGKPHLYTASGKVTRGVEEDDDFQKIMDKITVYPVLKFTLAGKIF